MKKIFYLISILLMLILIGSSAYSNANTSLLKSSIAGEIMNYSFTKK